MSTSVLSLPSLARDVRASVVTECHRELGLDGLTVDVHIEDLHD